MENSLPPIPAKRYFTISEVGDLCGVKPHVLRYWEQEFTQLRPMKRSGNRRYYQHNEVLMIRRIRELLYDQGFTIHGARNQMQEIGQVHRSQKRHTDATEFDNQTLVSADGLSHVEHAEEAISDDDALEAALAAASAATVAAIKPATSAVSSNFKWQYVRQELNEIRELLSASSHALQV
jgi:DNA-binding transcriptional MerR regulator